MRIIGILFPLVISLNCLSQCDLSQGLHFVFTQSELVELLNSNPDCEEIDRLFIDDKIDNLDPIIDLTPLTRIKSINHLLLRDVFALESLKGLESLRTVDFIGIRGADELKDVSALNGLDSLRSLNFQFNDHINSTSSLKFIHLVREGLSLDGDCQIEISDYDVLKFVLNIQNNSFPNEFKDFFLNQPDTLLLNIRNCANFSFKGFEDFDYIDEIWINGCDNCSLEGFQNLKSVRNLAIGGIEFNQDPSFFPFKNLLNVNYLAIGSIKRKIDFSQYFPKLESIEGRFSLFGNDSIYHISVLNNVSIPTQPISTNISTNLFDLHRHERIVFQNNNDLDYCYNDFICKALTTYPDSVIIDGNGTESCQYFGLLSYCENLPSGNIILPPNEKEELKSVFPNPSIDFIVIDLEISNEPIELIIYDLGGNPVLKSRISGTNKIDISTLEKGIYTYVVVTGGRKYSEKFVKI